MKASKKMKITAREYWTKILPECIIKSLQIPQEFYYLITPYKTLQEKITKEVIKEFINESLKELITEIILVKNLRFRNNYYITSSYNTNDIEDIIKIFYKVNYINDEEIEIIKKVA